MLDLLNHPKRNTPFCGVRFQSEPNEPAVHRCVANTARPSGYNRPDRYDPSSHNWHTRNEAMRAGIFCDAASVGRSDARG